MALENVLLNSELTDTQQLAISYDESIYTMETGECHKSGFHISIEPAVKYLAALQRAETVSESHRRETKGAPWYLW